MIWSETWLKKCLQCHNDMKWNLIKEMPQCGNDIKWNLIKEILQCVRLLSPLPRAR